MIGIVASRLVERFHRPVVLIAGGDDDAWKGSGRSIALVRPARRAVGAARTTSSRWGGHRAAAGLSIDPDNVDAFARAFAEHADAMLSDEELRAGHAVDAIVPRGLPLTLELAEELAQLAPFGLGNPGVTLLAPACELRDLGTVGDGKHLQFRVRGEDGRDAGSAIAFGMGSQLDRLRRVGRYDVVFRLEENRWNGTVAPQLVVRRVFDADDRYDELSRWLREQWRAAAARRRRAGRSSRSSSWTSGVGGACSSRSASGRCSRSRRRRARGLISRSRSP